MKANRATKGLIGLALAGTVVISGPATANADPYTGPGAEVGQTDMLLNGEETARAASGDVWAAFSYCSPIIGKYGSTWSVIAGGAGAALAAPVLGVGALAGAGLGAGVGGAGGVSAAAIGCTGMVIDAAKAAKAQGKWAGLTFAPPGGGWTWTY